MWRDGVGVNSLAFGYDDDGPYVAVGIWPVTAARTADATTTFAPHRVIIREQGTVVPL